MVVADAVSLHRVENWDTEICRRLPFLMIEREPMHGREAVEVCLVCLLCQVFSAGSCRLQPMISSLSQSHQA